MVINMKWNRLKKIIFTACFGVFAAMVLTMMPTGSLGNVCGVMECKAATRTITVKKANYDTAKKIDASLSKGKALTLKVKGKKKQVKRTLTSLQNQIKKVNRQSVVFHYYLTKKSNSSYLCQISKDNAQYYQYSVKFIKKIWGIAKKNVENGIVYTAYSNDVTMYPDETVRKKRQIYDFLVEEYIYGKKADGYDEKTTSSHVYFSGVKYEELESYEEKYVLESITTNTVRGKEVNQYHILSYAQFDEKYTLDEFADKITIDEPDSAQLAIVKGKDFCDLSSAVQVAAVSESGYFACRYKRSDKGGYGMVYSKKTVLGRGLAQPSDISSVSNFLEKNEARWNATTMKNIYRNKVKGVCSKYAMAESCVFDALGLKNEVGTGYNHAWQIIKVKNSDGKVMYVTFDYALGFRTVRGNESYEALSDAQKYRRIICGYFNRHPKEKMPKKQNFSYSTDIY